MQILRAGFLLCPEPLRDKDVDVNVDAARERERERGRQTINIKMMKNSLTYKWHMVGEWSCGPTKLLVVLMSGTPVGGSTWRTIPLYNIGSGVGAVMEFVSDSSGSAQRTICLDSTVSGAMQARIAMYPGVSKELWKNCHHFKIGPLWILTIGDI